MPGKQVFLPKGPGKPVPWIPMFMAFFGFLIINNFIALVQGSVRSLLVAVLVGYLPSFFDGSEYTSKSRSNPMLQLSPIWSWLVRAYKPTILLEEGHEPDSSRQAIVAGWPHAIWSALHLCTMSDAAGFFSRKIYTHKKRDLAACVVFKMPIVRDLILGMGNIDASKPVAKKALTDGYSLGIIPGGEREQMMTEYGKFKIFLKNRKGFVKLAVEFGVDIIPYFCFGETHAYLTSNFLLGFRQWLCRKTMVALPFFYNWCWSLPLPFPLVVQENPKPFVICFGRTIRVAKIAKEDPHFRDAVDRVHREVMVEVQRIFESRKDSLGYGSSVLEIS